MTGEVFFFFVKGKSVVNEALRERGGGKHE